jgi:hypothetical protein
MKNFLTLLLFSISLFGYAQNFAVTNDQADPYTDGDTIAATITTEDLDMTGEYIVKVYLINTSGATLTMNTLRTNIALPDGIRAYVCCLGGCYDDDKFAVDGEILPSGNDEYALHIQDTVGKFGLCAFKLEFWTKEDKTDMFTLYVEIDLLGEQGVKENSATTALLSAFPNPASQNSKINIDYTLAAQNDNQRLVIRNIVGATVMNIPLNPYENSIAIDASVLKAGIYFYAIENKNQIVVAKKLVVR